MKTENQWKAALKRSVEAAGGVALSLHGHGMQAAGWPDLWVGHRLWKGWIELKAHNGELRTDQRIVCRKLSALHSVVILRASIDWKTCSIEDIDGGMMPGEYSSLDAFGILGAL